MSTDEQFNPADKFIKIQGGALYLQVKDRLLWLRTEAPDSEVRSECIRLDADMAFFKVSITKVIDGRTVGVGEGHGSETPRGFPDYIEKAETIAMGRALGALGYGTAAAFEEAPGAKIADAPVREKGPQPPRQEATRAARATPLPGTDRVSTRQIDHRTGEIEDAAPSLANAGQISGITGMWKKLGRSDEELARRLTQDYAQERVEALTFEDAGKLIVALTKELNVERAMATA